MMRRAWRRRSLSVSRHGKLAGTYCSVEKVIWAVNKPLMRLRNEASGGCQRWSRQRASKTDDAKTWAHRRTLASVYTQQQLVKSSPVIKWQKHASKGAVAGIRHTVRVWQ